MIKWLLRRLTRGLWDPGEVPRPTPIETRTGHVPPPAPSSYAQGILAGIPDHEVERMLYERFEGLRYLDPEICENPHTMTVLKRMGLIVDPSDPALHEYTQRQGPIQDPLRPKEEPR